MYLQDDAEKIFDNKFDGVDNNSPVPNPTPLRMASRRQCGVKRTVLG